MGNIAKCIKKKLDANGVTAYQLEKQLGLKRSAINNIIYGKSKSPGIEIISSIAKGLDCSINELICDSEESIKSAPAASNNNNHDIIPENMKLYYSCLQLTSSLLKKRLLTLSPNDILRYVDEVYTYSLKSSDEEVDTKFAHWIVDKIETLQRIK